MQVRACAWAAGRLHRPHRGPRGRNGQGKLHAGMVALHAVPPDRLDESPISRYRGGICTAARAAAVMSRGDSTVMSALGPWADRLPSAERAFSAKHRHLAVGHCDAQALGSRPTRGLPGHVAGCARCRLPAAVCSEGRAIRLPSGRSPSTRVAGRSGCHMPGGGRGAAWAPSLGTCIADAVFSY